MIAEDITHLTVDRKQRGAEKVQGTEYILQKYSPTDPPPRTGPCLLTCPLPPPAVTLSNHESTNGLTHYEPGAFKIQALPKPHQLITQCMWVIKVTVQTQLTVF